MAPASGYGDIYFSRGSTPGAPAFQDTVQKLARHMLAAAGWKQGPTLGKAMMTNLRDPVLDLPTRPVRMYYQNTDGAVTTDQTIGGTKKRHNHA